MNSYFNLMLETEGVKDRLERVFQSTPEVKENELPQSVRNASAGRWDVGRTRRAVIDWLSDKLTEPSCPLTTQEMNHLRMVTAYFPEDRETADKIDRIFGDTPELRQTILLSTIVTCLDRLL